MNDPSKPSVTIKKYANRRLYNTATSSYVTLENLAVMVKEGIEFNVYDAKTSEDITRSVLTQIIVEEEGKTDQQNLLPVNFLRQLIGFYGNNMQWLVPKYLEHSMDTLSNNQDQITSYFQSTFGNMFPFGSAFGEMSKQNLAIFERAFRMFAPFVAPGLESAAADKLASTEKAPTPEKMPAPVVPLDEACACSCSATAAMPVTESKPVVTPIIRSVDPVPSAPPPVVVPPPVCSLPVEKAPAPALVPEPAPEAVHKPAPAAFPVSSSPPLATPPSAVPVAPEPAPVPAPIKHSAPTSAAPTADDMQQKIANLQRQLADLAKNRA